MRVGMMSTKEKMPLYGAHEFDIKYTAKFIKYPTGTMDIYCSNQRIFGPAGYELGDGSRPKGSKHFGPDWEPDEYQRDPEEDRLRSMRRARAKVRRLALSNDFKYFVTLTLDPAKVDSHDGAAVVKKLNAWCSNAVQRHGLRYILVPERHKKGGIHFHGFFNDAFPAVDSGTIRVPGIKKPRKPRSAAERAEWLAAGGQVVYNLPGWSLGFTTAMELYGEYQKAVSYVCKYIGKDGEKPAGRWYYSGGDLQEPEVWYEDILYAEIVQKLGDSVYKLNFPTGEMVIIKDVLEQVQCDE